MNNDTSFKCAYACNSFSCTTFPAGEIDFSFLGITIPWMNYLVNPSCVSRPWDKSVKFVSHRAPMSLQVRGRIIDLCSLWVCHSSRSLAKEFRSQSQPRSQLEKTQIMDLGSPSRPASKSLCCVHPSRALMVTQIRVSSPKMMKTTSHFASQGRFALQLPNATGSKMTCYASNLMDFLDCCWTLGKFYP